MGQTFLSVSGRKSPQRQSLDREHEAVSLENGVVCPPAMPRASDASAMPSMAYPSASELTIFPAAIMPVSWPC
jgi:hypothetical protein